MVARDLFRTEVLQARRGQWLGTINLATPLSFKWWSALALVLAVFVVLFLVFGHYTRRETVAGQLLPNAGMLTLTAQTTGTITRTFVRQGEQVHAGQPLIEVSANLISASGNTYQQVATQLRAQVAQVHASLANLKPQAASQKRDIQRRINMFAAQISQIDAQLALAHKQVATAEAFLGKIRPLLEKGFISAVQFNGYQSAALNDQAQVKTLERQRIDIKQQRSNLQAQLTQLPMDTATKANQLRGQLAQLQAQLVKNDAQGGTVLRAPGAGVISTLLVKPGQNVVNGQTVLSILPRGSKLQAQLLVSSSAIGFISTGDRVALRYQAYPYQQFGQQYGTVVQVSRSALSRAEVANLLGQEVAAPQYRVLVKLDRQNIHAYGKTQTLKPGMALQADVLLDRLSLWEWVFKPLYGLHQELTAQTGGTHREPAKDHP